MRKNTAFILVGLFLFLCTHRVAASVAHYFLVICRDGKNLELRKEKTAGETEIKVKFRHNEDPAELAKKLAPTGIFEKRLWVYFHCMWGNNNLFHQMTLGYIDEIVDNGQENILLSVIWPANQPGYRQNWKKVTTKGNRLGNFFCSVASQQKAGINILSHSMGNRVFQGMWQKAGAALHLENVVLASPDLDTDIFERDFKNLSAQTQRIIMVQHHKDRLLLASTLVLGRERLGRTRKVQVPENMVVIDATPYASARVIDLSNHLHFIFAEAVRDQLKKLTR